MRHTTLLVIACLPAALRAEEPVCERSGSRTTPSPDGQWVANVQEEVCATATGAAAGITVILSSVKDPERSKRVFVMPVPRSRDDWPRIRWLDANAVELRVANLSEAPAPEAGFAGIRIALAFCNDNPADRASLVAWKAAVLQWQKDVTAWAERRKQDATAAGPRPPRPEEPKLSPGHCTD
jgi:hypothetical protein